jgi:hypothetical protein
MTSNTILAKPTSDKYSRLFWEVDMQHLPTGTSREAIPDVHFMDNQDWLTEINFPRRVASPVGVLDLSGTAWTPGTATGTVSALFSRAPGTVFNPYGSIQALDQLALSSQAQANDLAGLVLAKENNLYPDIPIEFRNNDRTFDIAPNQYATVTIAPSDNNRGISLINKKIIPRRLNLAYDAKNGKLRISGGFEAETDGGIAVTVIPPTSTTPNTPTTPTTPTYPTTSTTPTPVTVTPPTIPSEPDAGECDADVNAAPNGWYDAPMHGCTYGSGDASPIYGGYDNTNTVRFRASLRSAAHVNKTKWRIDGLYQRGVGGPTGTWSGDGGDISTPQNNFYTVQALDIYGNVVATGVPDDPLIASNVDWQYYREGTFNNVPSINFDFLRVTVNDLTTQSNLLTGTTALSYTNWTLAGSNVVTVFTDETLEGYYVRGNIVSEADIGSFIGVGGCAYQRIYLDRSAELLIWVLGSKWHITAHGEFSAWDDDIAHQWVGGGFWHHCDDSEWLLTAPHWKVEGYAGGECYEGVGTDIDLDYEITSLGQTQIRITFMSGQGPKTPAVHRTFSGWAQAAPTGSADARICFDTMLIKNICDYIE